MIKAVIFDFDGTLINTNSLIHEGLHFLSERYRGKKLERETLRAITGKTLEDQLAEISPDKVNIMVDQFQIWYRHHHNAYAKAFPGVLNLLNHLSEMGIRMGIVTNNSTHVMGMGVTHLGIKHHFDVYISRDDVKETKPHPEGLLKALTFMGLSADEVLYVGDSESDMKAAKAAGIMSVFVNWSLLDSKQFECSPDFIIQSPDMLMQYISTEKAS